jgi:hypothetical protein
MGGEGMIFIRGGYRNPVMGVYETNKNETG